MTGRNLTVDDLYLIDAVSAPASTGLMRRVGSDLQLFNASAGSLLPSGSVTSVETPTADRSPKSSAAPYKYGLIDSEWIRDGNAIGTFCGDGSDGDTLIDSVVRLTKNVKFKTVTFAAGGKLYLDGWDFSALVVDVTNAGASAFMCGEHNGGTSGSGGAGAAPNGVSNGSLADHYSAPPLGGSSRPAVSATGGVTTGVAATAVASSRHIGGRGGAGGAGGLGPSGAGGAGGAAGSRISQHTNPEAKNLVMMDASTMGGTLTDITDCIAQGGEQGGSGGGGGGDGTNSGAGGGVGGQGTRVGRMRIGKLIGLSTAVAPVFDGRGCNGGNGGARGLGNTGGGGAGGGGGGGAIILIVGEISGSKTSAINCTGGNGGVGGNGFGTGVGGVGGAGGNGGYIYVRKIDLKTITILDNSGTTGTAGGAPSGVTGGTAGVGVSTVVNL